MSHTSRALDKIHLRKHDRKPLFLCFCHIIGFHIPLGAKTSEHFFLVILEKVLKSLNKTLDSEIKMCVFWSKSTVIY